MKYMLSILFVAVTFSASAQPDESLDVLVVDEGRQTLSSIVGQRIELSGAGTLRLRGRSPKLEGGEIHFLVGADDAVLLFDQIKPSVVLDQHLAYVYVDGAPAIHGENVRLVPTPTGTRVVAHGPAFEALSTFREVNWAGSARKYVVHQYYRGTDLGDDEDRIRSFRLKRGYMATLAENADGTGASQVFIARDRDLEVGSLPDGLDQKVSFVRVFPWRYTGKKGFGGKRGPSEQLGSQWYYNWGAGGSSTLDMEYVPMRHNANWDSFEKINQLEDVTHLLGFNEPNQPDQANMTVEAALDMWPKLQASGLRLGSPSPNDAQRGLDWLYEFMDEADKRGYRVDFVAVHYYKADWQPKKLISWLREIHERTGRRPIWLTEFNNGAPWTKNHDPTYAENTRRLREYCRIMDATGFVERYAVFNLGPDSLQRQVIRNGDLTPTGQWYESHLGKEAYRE